MHPDSELRREALRLVRRGAVASVLGGLAWAGWETARRVGLPDALSSRLPGAAERDGDEMSDGFDADFAGLDDLGEGEEVVWQTRPLDADVRALVDAILTQTEDYGALALRAQLARATTTDLPAGDDVDDPDRWLATFEVPDDASLAVPATAEFPVKARFASAAGEPIVAYLEVSEGRLAVMWVRPVDPGADDLHDDAFAPARWPRPDEVTFWIDTRTGPEPLPALH